jgi:hypothetical protein
MDYAGVLTD